MTNGYGPPPREWQQSGGPPNDPDPSYRRRTPPPGPPPVPPPPPAPPPRRYPQPPPPARHLGGPAGTPVSARPNNAGSQPPAYPAYPPPIPTSPTVPRMPPRQPAGRPVPPPPGALRPGAPGRPGVPGRPPPRQPGPPVRPAPRRSLPPLAEPAPRATSALIKGAVPGLIRHLPHHKPWMVAIGAIAIVVVLSLCGLGSYLLVKDDRQLTALPPPTEVVPTRDISNRTADTSLMTVADVFPADKITAAPSVPPYQRIGEAQLAADCRAAASGDLGKLLVTFGCNQVIRATFSSTDGAYLVTAGIFNLKDATSASQAEEQIKSIDASKGRFSPYIATTAVKIFGRAPTQAAWDAEGHFLIYAVMARLDGKDLADNDPAVKIIVYDVVENYLRDHVVADWSLARGTPGPSGSANPASAGNPTSPVAKTSTPPK